MCPQYITLSRLSKDITGQRFNRLVALGPVKKDQRNQIVWLCQCDCGNTHNVIYSALRNGSIKSCGCQKMDALLSRSTTHGQSHTRLYKIWAGMIKRCTNPQEPHYIHYGGRGIIVCDEWRHDFMSFRNHVVTLDHCDEPRYSLDRIDNDGNYEPGNVRWRTQSQQTRNKRNNVLLTYNGKTQCVTAWAEELGINVHTIFSRLGRGLSDEQSLSTPQEDK